MNKKETISIITLVVIGCSIMAFMGDWFTPLLFILLVAGLFILECYLIGLMIKMKISIPLG